MEVNIEALMFSSPFQQKHSKTSNEGE